MRLKSGAGFRRRIRCLPAKPPNHLNRFIKPLLRIRRKLLAKAEFRCRNCQPPGFRRVAIDIASQRQHCARVGGVRHELRAVGGFELAQLNFPRPVHGGVHKDDNMRARNNFRVFGRKLLANERAHPWQVQ